MTTQDGRRLIFQPEVHRRLQEGITALVTPIRATLGPRPRNVAIASAFPGKTPELLDNGGLIARRVTDLPDPACDMGAMLVRHLLWRLHETVGDATATAAVLFQSVYNAGLRYLAAGGNAMLLKHHLEAGAETLLETLGQMTVRIEGKAQLQQLATSLCHDPELGKLLGEIFDIIGAYGQLDIREGQSRVLKREYVDGSYWPGGVFSWQALASGRISIENAAILITDLTVDSPGALVSALEAALQTGCQGLFIVARRVSDAVLGLLSMNTARFPAIAVRAPEALDMRQGVLEDIAVLSGGRLFLEAPGDRLERVLPGELGRARRIWADGDSLGIVGGKGEPRALRAHIARLRAAFERAGDQQDALLTRLGRLMSGSATLWIGAGTQAELTARKALAERTARTMRGAIREGILPGGGSALLACKPALQACLAAQETFEARAACSILLQMTETPVRIIAENSGYDPGRVLAALHDAGAGYGFDVRSGTVVEPIDAGIYDVAAAYCAAIRGAVLTAAQALTIDVLVHREKREVVLNPA